MLTLYSYNAVDAVVVPSCRRRVAPSVQSPLFMSFPATPPQVSATPQLQPSEIIVTLAHGTVATYARSRGQEPTKTNYDWKGGRVLHLPGWSVPHEGDTLVIMVEATSLDARYRVLAASNEDILPLDDGLPVQMSQLESEMR